MNKVMLKGEPYFVAGPFSKEEFTDIELGRKHLAEQKAKIQGNNLVLVHQIKKFKTKKDKDDILKEVE